MDYFNSVDEEHEFFVKLADFLGTDLGVQLVDYLKWKRGEHERAIEYTAKKLVTEADIERYKGSIMKDAGLVRVYNNLLDSAVFDEEQCKTYAEALRLDLLEASDLEPESAQP